jgi:hypothetical protein
LPASATKIGAARQIFAASCPDHADARPLLDLTRGSTNATGLACDLRRDSAIRMGAIMRSDPTTGVDLIARTRVKNRILALGVAGVVILMFVLAILAGVLDQMDAKTPGGLFARTTTVGGVIR